MEETRDLEERMRGKLNWLIGQYGNAAGMYPDEARSYVKDELQRAGLIEKSTKELDIKGMARACNVIEKLIEKLP